MTSTKEEIEKVLIKIRDSGMKIEVSPYVTDHRLVRRGFFERLFSRPWRPFDRHKQVYAPQIFLLRLEAGNVAIMSPQTNAIYRNLKGT